MNLQNFKMNPTLLLWGTFLITACGGASAQDADHLPNQRVPVQMTAPEAVLKQKVADASPAPETLFNQSSPELLASRNLLYAASQLSQMSEKAYLVVQQKWLGSTEAACNFFVITALCESGYCKSDKPFYRAAQFGEYFKTTGWVEVTLAEAKKFLKNVSEIDLVAQRGPLGNSSMGHIGIPIGLDQEGSLIVAQGNYHVSTHETEIWSDDFANPFHYFVNFAEASAHELY